MATAKLQDIFGGRSVDETMDRVIIVPSNTTQDNITTITLPSGYTWSDFEELQAVRINTSNDVVTNPFTIAKEVISDNPTGWSLMHRFSDPNNQWPLTITATSATTATVRSEAGGGVYFHLYQLVGLTKRYATENTSVTIDVNGGSDLSPASTYTIDILTELGADFVGKHLLITPEAFHEGIWADPKWLFFQDTNQKFFSQGIRAVSTGDSIVVRTGSDSCIGDGLYVGAPFNTRKNNAPCRLRITKVDRVVV